MKIPQQPVLPLTPILHPWISGIIADAALLHEIIAQHGSPVNIHCLQPFKENMEAFGKVFQEKGLDYRIYFARKANKCLSFALHSYAIAQGVDTASYRELRQCLDAGISGNALISTAAVKTPQLLELAISKGVGIVIDNEDECRMAQDIASKMDKRVEVIVRLGGFIFQGRPLSTRFGWDIGVAEQFILSSLGLHYDRLDYAGLHFHLNGYSIAQRGEAILQCLALTDRLTQQGVNTGVLDIGGGILVNYLQSGEEWEAFNKALKEATVGKTEPVTYLNNPLGNVYPYFNTVHKEHFLSRVLEYRSTRNLTAAEELRKRGIYLRMEPGRSALDQCGITVARVIFRKEDNQGNLLVGLEMNGSQLRSSSFDFLLDPFHIPSSSTTNSGRPVSGFLVGAYCLEQDFILKRRIRFQAFPQVGDLMVFVNTAGYMMHFYESEAHQLELAHNVFFDPATRHITEDIEFAASCRT